MCHSEKIIEITNSSSNKLKEKGSQFIGYAINVYSIEEAQLKLSNLKKEYYDATHHCYAYKLIDGDEKYSDDGEPNGTAGIRILNAINHFNITNIIVVIIRYFGGTKLGVGPLGKAYGETAFDVLTNAPKIELTKFEKINISFDYENVSTIHYFINKYNCQKINNLYSNSPEIEFYIEPYLVNNFSEAIINKTNGNAKIHKLGKQTYLRLQ